MELKKVASAYKKSLKQLDMSNDFFENCLFDISLESALQNSMVLVPKSKKDIFNKSHKQICVYSFPYKILCKYYGRNKIKTKNEKIEDIEILRLIDNGENVSMLELNDNIVSVDTKKDFMKAKKIFSKQYF